MTPLHPQPLPSAEAIAGNEDMMTEILICLPAKSLCRFKCVSKQWNSLISHPHFSRRRLSKSISGFHLPIYWHADLPSYIYVHLAGKRTRGDPFTSLTFVDEPMGIKILHSSNGFLLCSSSNHSHNPNPNYYIYNPTTKQFAIIPPPNDDATCDASAMNLAFDPNKAPHYKIVLVRSRQVRTIRSWNNQIEIYSSENGSWRLSGDPFTCKYNTSRVFKNGVFCNGTIHWLNSSVMESWLRFDVDKECLGTMPMLPIQDGRDRMVIDYFGESQGHLHLVCCKSYSAPFEVFELESDYSKWFVKYHVHLNAITATFPQCPSITIWNILHLVREEVEEESYLVLYMPGLVVSYNFKDKTLKKLRNLFRDSIYFEAHHHIETLVHI